MPNAIFQAIDESFCMGCEPSEIITRVEAPAPFGDPVPGLPGWEVCGIERFRSPQEDLFWHLMRPIGILEDLPASSAPAEWPQEFWFYCTPRGDLITYGFNFQRCGFTPGEILSHTDLEGETHRFRLIAVDVFQSTVEFPQCFPCSAVHRLVVEAEFSPGSGGEAHSLDTAPCVKGQPDG